MARQEYVERLEKPLENSRMHIKFLEYAVDSFRNTVSEMRADVLRQNKPTEDNAASDEPTTAQKAIAQGQKQAAEIGKLKNDIANLNIEADLLRSQKSSLLVENKVLKRERDELASVKDSADLFHRRIAEVIGCEVGYETVRQQDVVFKRLKTMRIDAESVESMSENIEELYEKLRDAEDRYGRLDAMLEQSEGDIDSIATLLGLHHKNEDREVLISKIRDRIEHIKEERDKFNQMYDDECRLTRQAESELSQIASALDISNENACDARFKLILSRINDMKQSLTVYGSTDKYKKMLSGLLARIHRDGGHAIERLGIDAAVKAADALISDLLVAKDEAKQNKEAFEAELEGNKRIREILGAREDEGMFDLANRIAKERAFYGIVQAQIENAARDMRNFGK